MSTSAVKEPKILSPEEAQAKGWDDEFTKIYNDYQAYCWSGGQDGAPITDAKNINFPRDLTDTYFRGANLMGADLEHAYLDGANLRDAHLEYARLKYARLEGADLTGADLEGAHLEGADLTGAHLESATIDCHSLFCEIKKWENVDFTNTKIRRDEKLLMPDESRPFFKERMDELEITNARGLEDEAPTIEQNEPSNNAKKKIAAVSFVGGLLASGALFTIFSGNAEPNPLEGLSPADQENVCALPTANNAPSIKKACAEAGLALPADAPVP